MEIKVKNISVFVLFMVLASLNLKGENKIDGGIIVDRFCEAYNRMIQKINLADSMEEMQSIDFTNEFKKVGLLNSIEDKVTYNPKEDKEKLRKAFNKFYDANLEKVIALTKKRGAQVKREEIEKRVKPLQEGPIKIGQPYVDRDYYEYIFWKDGKGQFKEYDFFEGDDGELEKMETYSQDLTWEVTNPQKLKVIGTLQGRL